MALAKDVICIYPNFTKWPNYTSNQLIFLINTFFHFKTKLYNW